MLIAVKRGAEWGKNKLSCRPRVPKLRIQAAINEEQENGVTWAETCCPSLELS